MQELIFCLDSGTTSVKAAAFSMDGRLLAISEQPNQALRRNGQRVEQDMELTRSQAWATLAACAEQVAGRGRPLGLIVTGQGEGLWPIDSSGQPLRAATTWLDGRASGLVADPQLRDALASVAALTSSRPTAASPAMQLLWFQKNEPETYQRMGHALRAKEWLFHGLTRELVSEPSTSMLAWGNWRTQTLDASIPQLLGLGDMSTRLPDVFRTPETSRPLCQEAASTTGLAVGLPVLMGPSDVQATALGLGVGALDTVKRASIFGTSAVHVGHFDSAQQVPEDRPAGAMLQASVREGGYFCVFPGLNGTTIFQHLQDVAGIPKDGSGPAPSAVLLHPFFESGGERAPITDLNAKGALLGVNAQTTHAEIAWAARESLAFNARMCHDTMGAFGGVLAFGGGLANDGDFGHLLGSVMGHDIWRPASAHAGLFGIALIAASTLSDQPIGVTAQRWFADAGQQIAAPSDPFAEYVQRKYGLYRDTVALMSPVWKEMQQLQALAAQLSPKA